MPKQSHTPRWIFICLLFAACAGGSVRYEPDFEPDRRVEMGLKGPVEVIREATRILGNDPVKGWDTLDTRLEEIRFDPGGKRLNQETRNGGRLVSQIIYAYDTAGRLTEQVEHNREGQVETTRTKAYGRNGKLEEVQDFTAEGKLFSKMRYAYDRENRLLQSNLYFYDRVGGHGRETTAYRSECEYQAEGDYIQRDFRDGELVAMYIYKGGMLQRAEKYADDGNSLTVQSDFHRSEEGRRTREIRRDGRGNLQEVQERLIGPYGLVEEKSLGPDSLPKWMKFVKYDQAGRRIEERFYTAMNGKPGIPLDTSLSEPIMSRIYYDKIDGHGNWTESRTYENDSLLTKHITRKFIYFPED